MFTFKILFFFSLIAVFYNYAGYAVVVWLFTFFKKKRRPSLSAQFYPTVSFIVAAYNEEDFIEKKIINSLQLSYAPDRIEYLFITDGSTDGTNDIIKRYPSVQLLYSPERRGKSAALNRAVALAANDILIFSDANTMLNEEVLINITRHYSDARTGGVAGEKKVISLSADDNNVGEGEGLYWKYESKLKQLDSDFYSVVGAAGELFSVRRELYEPVSHQVILDDFIISMRVAQRGFRIVYEPDAFAMELPSFSMEDEQKRKVRIAAGGFQAMSMLRSLLLFWQQPKLSFLYISHRVLRWTLSPVCLILAFICNVVLYLGTNSPTYTVLFYLQLFFYSMAVLAAVGPGKIKEARLLRLAYYFVFMNLSVIQGFFRYLRGAQPAAWEKARRSKANGTVKT